MIQLYSYLVLQYGRTALMVASSENQFYVVMELLDAGADKDAKDKVGVEVA